MITYSIKASMKKMLFFYANQNAKLIVDAEQYYRALIDENPPSWNVRDQHMFNCLVDLQTHLSNCNNKPAKIVVWAHNSHIGNAAATQSSEQGEINIGQLAKQHYNHKCLLIGFSTCRGEVSCADHWGDPVTTKIIQEPFSDSYEEIFHHVNYKQFLLDLRENNSATDLLLEPKLQRAIGIIYRPETERMSHYFYTSLPNQFDMMIHIDNTTAVRPI